MSKQAVETWYVSELEELTNALHEVRGMCLEEGSPPDTVYVELRLKLVRETLTDGSTVYQLEVKVC